MTPPVQLDLVKVARTMPRDRLVTKARQIDELGPLFRPRLDDQGEPLPLGQLAKEEATDASVDVDRDEPGEDADPMEEHP